MTTPNECGLCHGELGDELLVENAAGRKAHERCYRDLSAALAATP